MEARRPKQRSPFAARKGPDLENRRRGPEPFLEAEPLDPRIERSTEAVHEEEDDFADGRSSAGMTLRAEEDEWGRVKIGERPFEEEDVPPRIEEEPEEPEEEED